MKEGHDQLLQSAYFKLIGRFPITCLGRISANNDQWPIDRCITNYIHALLFSSLLIHRIGQQAVVSIQTLPTKRQYTGEDGLKMHLLLGRQVF